MVFRSIGVVLSAGTVEGRFVTQTWEQPGAGHPDWGDVNGGCVIELRLSHLKCRGTHTHTGTNTPYHTTVRAKENMSEGQPAFDL